MVLHLAGMSFQKIAEKMLAHADTVRGWWKRLCTGFAEHALHLRKRCSRWGVHQTVKSFWQAVVSEGSLAQAMGVLHASGVSAP